MTVYTNSVHPNGPAWLTTGEAPVNGGDQDGIFHQLGPMTISPRAPSAGRLRAILDQRRVVFRLDLGTVPAMAVATDDETGVFSVTHDATKGVSKLVHEAEAGHDLAVSKRNRPIAAIVNRAHLGTIQEQEVDLRDLTLVLTRVATDNGNRTSLDDAIAALGCDRLELEARLDAELAAEQD